MNKLDQLVHDWGWWNRAYTRLLLRSRGYKLESMARALPHVATAEELLAARHDAWLPLPARREYAELKPPAVALGEDAAYVVDYYRREFAPATYEPGVAYFHRPVLYGRQFSILSRGRMFEECFSRDRRWREGAPKKPVTPREVGGTFLLAGAEFHNHFAHLFCDVVPRWELFEEAGVAGAAPALLPPPSHGFAEQAWRRLGISEGAAQWDDSCWQLDGLYFAAAAKKFCSWTPESAGWMRRKFAPGIEARPVGKRAFYISRRAGVRPVLNEAELLRELARFEVEVVQPETMPLEEQIALFAEARLIMGPQGAGIQNALWAPRGCRVLELVNVGFFSGVYWTLAASLGQRYGVVTARPEAGSDPVNAGYRCEAGLVREAVEALR